MVCSAFNDTLDLVYATVDDDMFQHYCCRLPQTYDRRTMLSATATTANMDATGGRTAFVHDLLTMLQLQLKPLSAAQLAGVIQVRLLGLGL